jgi:hypothetical protein
VRHGVACDRRPLPQVDGDLCEQDALGLEQLREQSQHPAWLGEMLEHVAADHGVIAPIRRYVVEGGTQPEDSGERLLHVVDQLALPPGSQERGQ